MPSPRRYAVNLSILFTEVPFLERPRAAAEAGFDAVECWWPWNDTATPDQEQVDAFVTAIEDAGIALVGLNFFAGDMPGGDRGLFAWPEREPEIRANIPIVAEIGRRVGCKAFNALYGNRVEGGDAEAADRLAVRLLAEAGRAVAADGGTILVEPVSGAPAYPLKRAADAIEVIDRVKQETGVENLGFLCDLYHLATNGDDVEAAIRDYGRLTTHVQIADSPGRGEPGTGALPLDRYLDALQAQGYDGYVALEYKTTSTTTEGLDGWLPRAERAARSHA